MASEGDDHWRARRWRVWLVGGAVLVVVVVAAAGHLVGKGPDEALRGLKDDPVANYEPEGGRLVSSSKMNADRSGFLGKPVHAEYRRTFKLPTGADLRAQAQSAFRSARAAGWQIDEGPKGAVSEFLGSLIVIGHKRLPDGQVKTMAITIFTPASANRPSNVQPPAMLIRLTSPKIDSR